MSSPNTFKDLLGNEYNLSLTLGRMQRVAKSDFSMYTQSEVTLDLITLENSILRELISNSSLCFAVIFVIISDQILTGKETEEEIQKAQQDFMDRIGPTQIQEGRDALWKALSDFFPELATALSTFREEMENTRREIAKDMEDLRPDIKAKLKAEKEIALAQLRRDLEVRTDGEKSTE